MALSLSGRLRVTMPTGPSAAYITSGVVMARLLFDRD
jgi:hypothetical protein